MTKNLFIYMLLLIGNISYGQTLILANVSHSRSLTNTILRNDSLKINNEIKKDDKMLVDTIIDSPMSEVISVSVDDFSNTNDEEINFEIYPNNNYANDLIHIKTNYNGEINVQILNFGGEIICNESFNVTNQTINSIKNLNLRNGVYNVIISSPKSYFQMKYLKLKIRNK